MFRILCCTCYQYDLPRHFFKRIFEDHLVLYDKSNSTKPLNFDVHLRYSWGEDRLLIIDRSHSQKVLYKVGCQTVDHCRILGWTKDRTDISVLTAINNMAWYPYPTIYDIDYYKHQESNETAVIIQSKALLKQPLLISTKLFDEVLNVTFFPPEKKYKIIYGAHHIIAEVENFDRSTPKNHRNETYSVQILKDVNPKIDPSFIIAICISIDYIEWPYYLSST